MVGGRCPDCGAEMKFESEPHLGRRLMCPDCGAILEVVGRSPIELDWLLESPLSVPWYTAVEPIQDERKRL